MKVKNEIERLLKEYEKPKEPWKFVARYVNRLIKDD